MLIIPYTQYVSIAFSKKDDISRQNRDKAFYKNISSKIWKTNLILFCKKKDIVKNFKCGNISCANILYKHMLGFCLYEKFICIILYYMQNSHEIWHIINKLYYVTYLMWGESLSAVRRGRTAVVMWSTLSLSSGRTVAAVAAGLVNRDDRRWCWFQRLFDVPPILKPNYLSVNSNTMCSHKTCYSYVNCPLHKRYP